MSLLSKLEKLERTVSSRHEADSFELSPELSEFAIRLLHEISTRPEPTIHEQIAELRDRIKRNESIEEPWKFLDEWSREELARLEARAPKLS